MKDKKRTKVSILKVSDYDYNLVKTAVIKSFDYFGGIEKFVKKGDKVLIKPNLLGAKPPEAAVTTHPSLVQAVCELVNDMGAKPIIGDSPAIGKFETVAKATKMFDVSKKTGAALFPFEQAVLMEAKESNVFKHIEICNIINQVDVIINLPKLKSHSQMLLTLGVKNIYGFVVGKKKAKLHMEAGSNPIYFANMLTDIYNFVKPDFTIIDGIVGMEGNGPGSGDIRNIGLILASVDCFSLDRVICEIVGSKKDSLYTTQVAIKNNYGETNLKYIDILGETIDKVKINDFKFPKIIDIEFGPKFLRKFLKKLITSKPVENRKKCKLCDYCKIACPPEIIKKGADRLYINYDKCIRCYCCVEVCPHGAMEIKNGILARLLKF